MRRTIWASAGLMALAACSGGADAVGENSAGSIKTTAVGKVVGTVANSTAAGDNAIEIDNAATAVSTDDATSAPVNSSFEVEAGDNMTDH